MKNIGFIENVFSAYDIKAFTVQEVMSILQSKMNELISNDIELKEIIEYLRDEGLVVEINKKLEQWFNDGTLDDIINENIFNDLNDKIDDATNDLSFKVERIEYNLKDFGAVGDGITDDTIPLQKALKVAYDKGGMILKVPKGTYLIHNHADMFSNTIINFEYGAKFIKNKDSVTNYLLTVGRRSDMGTYGYGGGAKNIEINNGTFEGDVQHNKAISFTLNHMENLSVNNCKFINCVANGHVFDLAGCNNIKISNSEFIGFNLTDMTRGYTEAIQIDNSTSTGLSGNFSNYDNLPTKDVYVDNCKFLPYYDSEGNIVTPCPNPIGSHNYVNGHYFTNINFTNNYIENMERLGDDHSGGGIRFYAVKGLNIINNKFINTMSKNVYCISLQSKSIEGNLHQACSDIVIEHNLFEGFDYEGEDNYSLIRIYGDRDDNLDLCKNVTINNNFFKDCHLGDEHKMLNINSDLISAENCISLKITNNRVDRARRLAYINNSEDVTITSNSLYKCHYIPLSLGEINYLTIADNTFNKCGHVSYLRECHNTTFVNNKIVSCSEHDSGYGALSMFKTCHNVVVSNNIYKKGVDDIEARRVLHLYTNGKNVNVSGNILVGYSNDNIELTSDYSDTCFIDEITKTKFI